MAVFAALELGLALFTVISAHSFYTAIGPFGAFNPHYLRDVASFEGAIGIVLVLAVRFAPRGLVGVIEQFAGRAGLRGDRA